MLALGDEAVGSQVEDAFPHVPVRVLQEAHGMRGEEPRRMARNYQPATLQYCLPNHHFAIRQLLNQRGYQLRIMFFDINDAEHE